MENKFWAGFKYGEDLKKINKHLFQISMLIEELFKINRKDFYIAGGSICSIWHDEIPNDYDVFFYKRKTVEKLINSINRKQYNCYLTENSLTIKLNKENISSDNTKFSNLPTSEKTINIQFVKCRFGKPKDVVKDFDFLHTMVWYDVKYGTHIYKVSDFYLLKNKELIYNEKLNKDTSLTLYRLPKFLTRGFRISRRDMLRLIQLTNEHNKNDYDTSKLLKDKFEKSSYNSYYDDDSVDDYDTVQREHEGGMFTF